jgi:predicted RND superfamily exporter protein
VSRRELGSAVVVGLTVATLFGVFLVPALFTLVERLVRWQQRRRAPQPSPGGPSAPQVAPSHAEERGS